MAPEQENKNCMCRLINWLVCRKVCVCVINYVKRLESELRRAIKCRFLSVACFLSIYTFTFWSVYFHSIPLWFCVRLHFPFSFFCVFASNAIVPFLLSLRLYSQILCRLLLWQPRMQMWMKHRYLCHCMASKVQSAFLMPFSGEKWKEIKKRYEHALCNIPLLGHLSES